MSKGLAIPVRLNGRGGAKLLSGSAHTRQTIRAGLTPNTSRNPFQAGDGVEIGISERIVFANNVPGSRALARREITRFFARLRVEDIAKLAPGTEGLTFNDAGSELVARIRYVDLEADREDEVESNLRDALRGSPGNVGGIT